MPARRTAQRTRSIRGWPCSLLERNRKPHVGYAGTSFGRRFDVGSAGPQQPAPARQWSIGAMKEDKAKVKYPGIRDAMDGHTAALEREWESMDKKAVVGADSSLAVSVDGARAPWPALFASARAQSRQEITVGPGRLAAGRITVFRPSYLV